MQKQQWLMYAISCVSWPLKAPLFLRFKKLLNLDGFPPLADPSTFLPFSLIFCTNILDLSSGFLFVFFSAFPNGILTRFSICGNKDVSEYDACRTEALSPTYCLKNDRISSTVTPDQDYGTEQDPMPCSKLRLSGII